jgi:hypothetical protein
MVSLSLAAGLGLVSGCSFCFSTHQLFNRHSDQETTCCSDQAGASEGPMLDGMGEGPMLPPGPGCVPVPQGSVPQLAPTPRLVPQPETATTQPYTPTR